jgi:diguanylate cyclase (GGDEF)-like protein
VEFVNVATILLCTFIAILSASLTMLVVWMYNRREPAAGYWSVGFAVGAVGIALLVVRARYGSDLFTLISGFCAMTSYGLIWSGFRAFNGKNSLAWMGPVAGLLKVCALLAFPSLLHSVDMVVIVSSVPPALFAIAAGVEVLFNCEGERLPFRTPASIFFITHGLIRLLPLELTQIMPVHFEGGTIASVWLKLFLLESFLHAVFATFSCILLVKDRAEFRYRQASEVDSLTGINNRRAFVQSVENHLHGRNRDGFLAIMDLDHFKSVNDTYGHMAGDAVLTAFTRTVASIVDGKGVFGRFGGEEFALFVGGDDEAAFARQLEFLREEIAGMRIQFSGYEVGVSVSAGYASTPDAGYNFDNLMSAADCALYTAKAEGRDRICRFLPSMRLRKVVENGMETRVGLADFRITRRSVRSSVSASNKS